MSSFLTSAFAKFLVLKLWYFRKGVKYVVNSFYDRSWILKIIKIHLDKFTSISVYLKSVILGSFGPSFEGVGRFASVLMSVFFQDSMIIFCYAMAIKNWSSSNTDAFVSTLGNCFIDCPQCPKFQIMLGHEICLDF